MQIKTIALPVGLFTVSAVANAASPWTDWTSSSAATANGSLATGNGTTAVTFTGPNLTPPITRTDGLGTDYWANIGSPDPWGGNRPTGTDIIGVDGTGLATYMITFATAVVDPYLAVLSLGRPSQTVSWDFGTTAVSVKSQGKGHWNLATNFYDGVNGFTISGDTLTGKEGHGVVQFSGTFNQISWTSAPSEYWTGVQVGAASLVPEAEGYALAFAGIGIVAFAMRRRVKANA